MDNSFAKNIISTFNCDTFSKFIFELWSHKNAAEINTCIETKYINKLGNLSFESKKTIYTTNDKVLIDKQIFDLVIPVFEPFETLNSINQIIEENIKTTLRKYHKIVDNRRLSWFWACDGMYYLLNVAFVTNYQGIEYDKYYNYIIPVFEKIVEEIGLEAQVAVGSIDSFFELEEQATISTLSKFIEQYHTGLVLSFGNKISVNNFLTTNAIPYKTNKNLRFYEPLYVYNSASLSDILLEFEELLNIDSKESSLESFLKEYYRIIFGPQYDRIESQIWLQCKEFDIIGKNRRTDLFLRNSSNDDWELFELKKNKKKVITNKKTNPNFYKEIYDNILQLKEYQKIFNQEGIRNILKESGIEYFNPQFNLVIGRDENVSTRIWQNLVTHYNDKNFHIRTYNELLNELKSRVEMFNQLLIR